MNESIDLTKILKNCQKGTKLYSTVFGEVEFKDVNVNGSKEYPIRVIKSDRVLDSFTADGRLYNDYNGECTLFPSREQRDWGNFNTIWYKNGKFDPKTLNPFDKVLVSDVDDDIWHCNIFEYIRECTYPYSCVYSAWERCIPYNDETKHLLGTNDEAPEYYRYWED